MRALRVPILLLLALAIGYWAGIRSETGNPASGQGGSRAADESPAEASVPIVDSVAADQDRRGGADQGSGAIADATRTSARESEPPAEDPGARRERLLGEREEMRRALAEVEDELVGLSLASEPIISPIALPPEFDWIPGNSYRGLFHQRMQREPIDALWAATTEARLLQFTYDRPEIVRNYGVPTVRCHSTQCEVTFLARGVDGSAAAMDATALFNDSFEEMAGMFDCGPGECWADANSQGGAVTIFWGMTRKEEELQGLSNVTVARE